MPELAAMRRLPARRETAPLTIVSAGPAGFTCAIALARALRAHVGPNMRNSWPFGGFVNFPLPLTAVQGGRPVAGEQAGFQDAPAGFGIHYAMQSGLLAARSIVDGSDYRELWRRELRPLLVASTVNRFLFNVLGEPGWRVAVRKLSQGDARQVLRRFHGANTLSKLLFPALKMRHRAPSPDRSCDHVACHCVWRERQAEFNAAALA